MWSTCSPDGIANLIFPSKSFAWLQAARDSFGGNDWRVPCVQIKKPDARRKLEPTVSEVMNRFTLIGMCSPQV